MAYFGVVGNSCSMNRYEGSFSLKFSRGVCGIVPGVMSLKLVDDPKGVLPGVVGLRLEAEVVGRIGLRPLFFLAYLPIVPVPPSCVFCVLFSPFPVTSSPDKGLGLF